MKRGFLVPAFSAALGILLSCCTSSGEKGGTEKPAPKESTEEMVLKYAFNAIKQNKWGSFKGYSITPADYAIEETGLSDSQSRQTFAESSLRPRQQEELRERFDRAVSGCEGCIDFRNAEFAGIGTLIEKGRKSTIKGADYYYEVYSLRIRMKGKEIDTRDLSPKFAISYWKMQFRIIDLVFEDGY